MKRFLFLFVSVFLCLSLIAPAMASEVEGDDIPVEDTNSQVVVPDVNIFNDIIVEDTSNELGEYMGTSVYSLNPVTSNDANGLKSVMLSLIGDWDAVIVEHAYSSSQGYTNYLREVQLDYPWLCSCAIFLVVLFCILRGGFAVLCRK